MVVISRRLIVSKDTIRVKYQSEEKLLLKISLFHNIFNISLISGIKLNFQLWNVLFGLFFSSVLQIWYVEVQIYRSISESPLDSEIVRVDCI